MSRTRGTAGCEGLTCKPKRCCRRSNQRETQATTRPGTGTGILHRADRVQAALGHGHADAVGDSESAPAPAAMTVRLDPLPPSAPGSASARAAGQAGVARHAAASAPAIATEMVT